MTKTTIVATIGPVSNSPALLRALKQAGMTVARLNGSHGDTAWHQATIRRPWFICWWAISCSIVLVRQCSSGVSRRSSRHTAWSRSPAPIYKLGANRWSIF